MPGDVQSHTSHRAPVPGRRRGVPARLAVAVGAAIVAAGLVLELGPAHATDLLTEHTT